MSEEFWEKEEREEIACYEHDLWMRDFLKRWQTGLMSIDEASKEIAEHFPGLEYGSVRDGLLKLLCGV